MSLSFPPSAFVGQTYNGFTWDGVKWTATPFSSNPAQIVLEVSQAADFTGLTGSAWNTLKYSTKVTDLQNGYDPSTGNFTPRQAGVYLVVANVGVPGSTAAMIFGVQIAKNSAAVGLTPSPEMMSSTVVSTTTTAVNTSLSTAALIYCNGTTDFISARAYCPSAVTTMRGGTNLGLTVNMVATLLMVGPQGPAGTISPGNRALISQTTITTPVTSIDLFAGFDGTYDVLELHAYDILPATEAALLMRCSTDGSTFDTAALYNWTLTYGAGNATGAGTGAAAATQIQLSNALGTAVNAPSYHVIRMRVPFGTNTPKFSLNGTYNVQPAAALFGGAMSGNYYVTSGWVLGVRLFFTGLPNITRGTVKLYGIVK